MPYLVQSAANVGKVEPVTVGDCVVQIDAAVRNF